MRKHKLIKYNRIFFESILKLIGLNIFFLITAGCQDNAPDFNEITEKQVFFSASIEGPDDLSTRANYDITSEFFKCDFKICIERYKDNEIKRKIGTYMIPSGFSGVLTPREETMAVNWLSRKDNHNFWGWSWLPDSIFKISDPDLEESNKNLVDGIDVKFYNTDIQSLNSSGSSFNGGWANGQILEQMVGTAAGSFNYEDNGSYVPLVFKHLVSKIFLKEFNVVNNVTGAGNSGQKGIITFYGMPSTGKFYPYPQKEDGTPLYPYIEMETEWNYDPSKRQTFVISNSSRTYYMDDPTHKTNTVSAKDCWYIMPEVDLSQISFKIEIYQYDTTSKEWKKSENFGDKGAYYGDLRGVVFSRTNSDGNDDTILHAGEYLLLNINAQANGHSTAHGTISSWSYSYKTGYSHVEQGLYTRADLKEFSDLMKAGNPEAMENFYNLYGNGRDTGSDTEGEYPDYEKIYGKELKIFEIFDDLGSESTHNANQTNAVSNDKIDELYTGDDYIIDGNGHTVSCLGGILLNPSIKIGHVRNIYLRRYVRNNNYPYQVIDTIYYIDNKGDVWSVDPVTFEHTYTGNNINIPGKNPVTFYWDTGNAS